MGRRGNGNTDNGKVAYFVTLPDSARAGKPLLVNTPVGSYNIIVPGGLKPGGRIRLEIRKRKQMDPSTPSSSSSSSSSSRADGGADGGGGGAEGGGLGAQDNREPQKKKRACGDSVMKTDREEDGMWPEARRALAVATMGCWLVNAMRFRTLWEHKGEECVVVCDIHDDFELQARS